MRVALYLRSATPEKENIEAQRELCLSYAKEKGHEVVAVYEDCGVPGYPNNGDGLNQMCAAALTGLFEGIVMTDIDRLSRLDYHQSMLLEFFHTNKVTIIGPYLDRMLRLIEELTNKGDE